VSVSTGVGMGWVSTDCGEIGVGRHKRLPSYNKIQVLLAGENTDEDIGEQYLFG